MSVSSMTGFASVEIEVPVTGGAGANRFRAEVRSVNHRYLDCRVRLPRDLASAESAVRAKLAEKFARG
ncbi:MAG: YicC/YloC family endoribonuclease, partial [Bdellovibrionota bacterium]